MNLMDYLWAKTMPHKSLISHMNETAIVCKVLLRNSIYSNLRKDMQRFLGMTGNEVENFCMYLASMHDIGKCHPVFQYKAAQESIHELIDQHTELQYPLEGSGYRHELGSEDAVRRIWRKKKRFSGELIAPIAAILKFHHQGKRGKTYSLKGIDEWISCQDKIEELMYEMYKPAKLCIEQIQELDASCTLLTGLIILSDWIASNEIFSQFDDSTDPLESEQKAVFFLQESGLVSPSKIAVDDFSELWPHIPFDGMRPLQTALQTAYAGDEEKPLLLIIEAPMGEGKTEAGLYAAIRMAQYWNKSGIYVALPTSATSNQMYQRVENMLHQFTDDSVRLMHSMAWMSLEDKTVRDIRKGPFEEIAQWTRPNRRALLSNYAVGTIDQILMAALKIKFGVLRILGLYGKVLFIDEVHAYDAYMSSILKRLLEWCKVLHIPVVLLSATLPVWKKKELVGIYGDSNDLITGYQQYTAVYKEGRIEQKSISECSQNKSITIEKIVRTDDEDFSYLDRICHLIQDGGCICIIVNTIKSAQRIYKEIQRIDPSIHKLLFHSAFTVAKRQEIENQCLSLFGKDKSKRPRRFILVATQVVEQSLDLDFDYMISEIAPIDLLLQRAGRLHRHTNTCRPKNWEKPALGVMVTQTGYGATELIYYPILLERTVEVINSRETILIPDDIPQMIENVYQRDDFETSETEKFLEQMFSEQMMDSEALGIELGRPMKDDFGLALVRQDLFDDEEGSWVAAKTRLGEDTVRIAMVPPDLYEEVQNIQDNAQIVSEFLARQVMEYSVSVSKKKYVNWGLKDSTYQMGKGRLMGVFIFRMNLEQAPTETLLFDTPVGRVIVDKEIGVRYERRGINEV